MTAAAAAPAMAEFGLGDVDLTFTDAAGLPQTQAGSHPFAVTNTLDLNTFEHPVYGELPDGAVKDITVSLPDGLVGAPGATPRCSSADFLDIDPNLKLPHCANSSAIGLIVLKIKVAASGGGEYLS